MSLSAPGLAICENGSIVALDDGLDQRECTLVINRLLLSVSVVDGIESEIFGRIAGQFRFQNAHLIESFVHHQDRLATLFLFFFIHGPYSHHHLNCFS